MSEVQKARQDHQRRSIPAAPHSASEQVAASRVASMPNVTPPSRTGVDWMYRNLFD